MIQETSVPADDLNNPSCKVKKTSRDSLLQHAGGLQATANVQLKQPSALLKF